MSTIPGAAVSEGSATRAVVVGQPGKAVLVRQNTNLEERTVEERLDELSTPLHDELASLKDRIAALENEI